MNSTTQITDHIYQIRIPIPFPLRDVNCYLVREADGWTMIDTGLHHAPAFETWDAAFRAQPTGRQPSPHYSHTRAS